MGVTRHDVDGEASADHADLLFDRSRHSHIRSVSGELNLEVSPVRRVDGLDHSSAHSTDHPWLRAGCGHRHTTHQETIPVAEFAGPSSKAAGPGTSKMGQGRLELRDVA
jgi:hypothetical protein